MAQALSPIDAIGACRRAPFVVRFRRSAAAGGNGITVALNRVRTIPGGTVFIPGLKCTRMRVSLGK